MKLQRKSADQLLPFSLFSQFHELLYLDFQELFCHDSGCQDHLEYQGTPMSNVSRHPLPLTPTQCNRSWDALSVSWAPPSQNSWPRGHFGSSLSKSAEVNYFRLVSPNSRLFPFLVPSGEATGSKVWLPGVGGSMNNWIPYLEHWTNFERLSLGCINAIQMLVGMLVGKLLKRSVRLEVFCKYPIVKCKQPFIKKYDYQILKRMIISQVV